MARADGAGTWESRGVELGYRRDGLETAGVAPCLVDLGTSGRAATAAATDADVTAAEVAPFHPGGPDAVFTGNRGTAVTAMAEAFRRLVLARDGWPAAGEAGGEWLGRGDVGPDDD